jgi:hypothetical protein
MEGVEKSNYFVRLNFINNLNNIWSNSSTLATNINSQYAINFINSSIYNIQNTLTFNTNRNFADNKNFKVSSIKIYINPFFDQYYEITNVALNKKKNFSDLDQWVDCQLEYSNRLYNTSSNTNIMIYTNLTKTLSNFYHFFRVNIQAKIGAFPSMSPISTSLQLNSLDLFLIEISGSYVNEEIRNINILSNDFYFINISQPNRRISISENNYTNGVSNLELSILNIARITESSFVSQQPDIANMSRFVNVPGKIKTYYIKDGTMDNVHINQENSDLPPVNLYLNVTGGILSLYNIKNSQEPDKIMNFYVEISDSQVHLLPNSASKRIYIYSQDIENPTNLLINNTNPINLAGTNPLSNSSTGSSNSSLPSQINNENALLSTNGNSPFWTRDPALTSLTVSDNITSNKNFFGKPGISSDSGFNFSGSTQANLTGLKYNTDNLSCNIVNDAAVVLTAQKTLLTSNVPLNSVMNGTISNPNIKFNNVNTGIYSSTSQTDTMGFVCNGTNQLSISSQGIVVPQSIDCANEVKCETLNCTNIGTTTLSGVVKAKNFQCEVLTCDAVQYTGSNTEVLTTPAIATNLINAQLITTTFNAGNSESHKIYTGTLYSDNIETNNSIKVATGAKANPSIQFSDSTGIYQKETGALTISVSGTDDIVQINKLEGFQTAKMTATNGVINNLEINNRISLQDQGTLSEPMIQFADKSGIFQNNNGELNFCVVNNSVATDILSINSSGIVSTNVIATNTTTDKLVLDSGGVESDPALKFADNSGIYQLQQNEISFSVDGTNQFTITNSGISVPQNIICESQISSLNLDVTNTITSDEINSSIINVSENLTLNTSTNNSSLIFNNSSGIETEISQKSGGGLLFRNNNSTIVTVDPSDNSLTASKITSSNTLESQGVLNIDVGTLAAPSIQFSDASGMYQNTAGNINFGIKVGSSNVEQLKINADGITVVEDVRSQKKMWCENLKCNTNIETNTISSEISTVKNKINFNTSSGSVQNPLIEFFRGTRIYEVDSITGGVKIANSNGTELLDVNAEGININKITTNSELKSNGNLIISNGTMNAPALKFANDSGIYQQAGTTEIDFSINGNKKFDIKTDSVNSLVDFSCSGIITAEDGIQSDDIHTVSLNSDNIINKNQLKFTTPGTNALPSLLFPNDTFINENSDGGLVIKKNNVTQSGTVVDTLMNISATKQLDVQSVLSTTINATNLNIQNINPNSAGTSVLNIYTANVTDKINIPDGNAQNPSVRFNDGSGMFQSQDATVNFSVGGVQKLSIGSIGIYVPNDITCDEQISCDVLSANDISTDTLTVANQLTLNNNLVIPSGDSTQPSISFSGDSTKTGFYQSSAGKINISTIENSNPVQIVEFNSGGITTDKTIVSNTLNSNTITCSNVTVSTKLTCSDEIDVQNLNILLSGVNTNPAINFPAGTGLYELPNSGIAILGKNTSNQTIELFNINRDKLLTIDGEISTNTLTADSITIENNIECNSTITASNIVCDNSLQISNGLSNAPGLKFSDGTGIYQTAGSEIIFGKNNVELFKINSLGIETENDLACKDIDCTDIRCTDITNDTITSATANISNLNISGLLSIVDGLIAGPGIKFSDNSGMYRVSPGKIGFSDGSNQLLSLDSTSGLNTIYKITTTNNIQAQNIISNSDIQTETLTATTSINTNSIVTTGKVSIDWGSDQEPAIQLQNGSTQGVKIYQSSANELKIDKGTSNFLTINTNGIDTPNNISCSNKILGNIIQCNSISTDLDNTTNFVTTSTINTSTINLTSKINLPKGSINNTTLQFLDGSGIFQLANQGLDFRVGSDTQAPKLSVVSTGIISPNVNAETSFYVSTAGSSSALTLKNGINSTTGLWVNDITNEIGTSILSNNVLVARQTGLGITGSCNISQKLVMGSSGNQAEPTITFDQVDSGFFSLSKDICLSIAGTKRFEGITTGIRINGRMLLTSGSDTTGYISNGISNTRNVGIYDFNNDLRVEASTSGVTLNGQLTVATGTNQSTFVVSPTGIFYDRQVVIEDIGSNSAPTLKFKGGLNDNFNSGFRVSTSGEIHCVVNGTSRCQFGGGVIASGFLQCGGVIQGQYFNIFNGGDGIRFRGQSTWIYSNDVGQLNFVTSTTENVNGTERFRITNTETRVMGNLRVDGNIIPSSTIQPNINSAISSTSTLDINLSTAATRTELMYEINSTSSTTINFICDTNPTNHLKFSIYLHGNGSETNTFNLTNAGSTWGAGNHAIVTNFASTFTSGSSYALTTLSYTWTEPRIEIIDFMYIYNSTTPTGSRWVVTRRLT